MMTGNARLSRRGVVGELLIIIALLASLTLLVLTFTHQNDVPNINKESITVLKDIRDVLSRAILEWLKNDPIQQPLACNGVYRLPGINDLLTQSLTPYVQSAVADTSFEESKLTAMPGTLQSVKFAGLEGLTVTLANGTIIYNDSAIYAEDKYDKEYFFNVRIPLALKIVQDWLSCDAGNFSKHLSVAYGEACFYGKKDVRYPGACPGKTDKLGVTAQDRDYILAHSITEETVATAATLAVGELNKYFTSEESCKPEAKLSSNSGITCTFDVKELTATNYMTPWSSSLLPAKKSDTASGKEYMKDYIFDTQQFWTSQDQVYLLPGNNDVAPYTDEELACNTSDRDPVTPSINTDPLPQDEPLIDVAKGQMPAGFVASPILYLNITRGAKFLLNVKCKDEQASLLGQPLEYKFSIRYGVQQHCGPPTLLNGNFMCGGCGLKPGLNFGGCVNFGKPQSCSTYERICNENMMWRLFFADSQDSVHNANIRDNPWAWRGSMAETYDAYDTQKYPDAPMRDGISLLDYVNASCGTVTGYMTRYPPPPETICCKGDACSAALCPCNPNDASCTTQPGCNAYPYVCCGVYGYNDTCSPSQTYSNNICYFNLGEYTGLCTESMSCKPPGFSVGDKCREYTCNPDPSAGLGGGCQYTDNLLYDVPCGDDSGCYKCGAQDAGAEAGICGFDIGMLHQVCSQRHPDPCKTYTCEMDAGGGSCVSTPNPAVDGIICVTGPPELCSDFVCSAGQCVPKPAPEGRPCGFIEDTGGGQICRYHKICQTSGDRTRCSRDPNDSGTCVPDPKPPGGCSPPCDLIDGHCICG